MRADGYVRFYRALINLDFKNGVLWYIKDYQLIRPPKIVLWAGALKKVQILL